MGKEPHTPGIFAGSEGVWGRGKPPGLPADSECLGLAPKSSVPISSSMCLSSPPRGQRSQSVMPAYFYCHNFAKGRGVLLEDSLSLAASRVVGAQKMSIFVQGIINGDFPGGSMVKESACNIGDVGSIPVSGRPPREENGNPLQNSCLGNAMEGLQFIGSQKSWM